MKRLMSLFVASTILSGLIAVPTPAKAVLIEAPVIICYKDHIKPPSGQLTAIWMPGFPNLLNEELSLNVITMPLNFYEAGWKPWGLPCAEIIDATYEQVNGYTKVICGPKDWGPPGTPECPGWNPKKTSKPAGWSRGK